MDEWPNCTDPANLDTWPTKHEVMDKLGLSEKTIERRITEGALKKDFRIIPGRKPLPILHPVTVKELLDKKLDPLPQIVKPSPPAKLKRDETAFSPTTLPDMLKTVIADVVKELAQSSLWALKNKHYLTVKEAVTLTGLSEDFIKERCRKGIIPSLKRGKYLIRRGDLERYNAVTDKLAVGFRDETVWHNGNDARY